LKKSAVLFLTIVLLMVFTVAAASAGQFERVVFTVGESSYTVDGKTYETDAAPFIENNRAFVPVRYLARSLGVPDGGIGWSASARAVTLTMGDVTVEMAIGGGVIYINDEPLTIDVAPLIKDGRTYLPARYVAEAFGFRVEWDEATGKVIVTPPETIAAPAGEGAEEAVNLAAADFASRLGVPATQISLKGIEAVDWSDTSLGCPEPGQMYAQVITPGYKIVLTGGSADAEYHADRRGNVVLCRLQE
jgi:hypothetical protein